MSKINYAIIVNGSNTYFNEVETDKGFELTCKGELTGITFNSLGSIEIYLNNATVGELLALSVTTTTEPKELA